MNLDEPAEIASVLKSQAVVPAATLSIVPAVPVAGMALILGIDRCRSLTNFIGNAVATVVVARWEGQLDRSKLTAALNGQWDALTAELPHEDGGKDPERFTLNPHHQTPGPNI